MRSSASCTVMMLGVLCAFALSGFAQTHFTPAWSNTPYLAMNIYVTSAACDSLPVEAGDEIALFDGQTCVGHAVLQGPIINGTPLGIIASTDDPTTPAVDGFIPGQLLVIRIWRHAAGLEYPDAAIEKTFAAGTGTYASLGTAVVALAARRITSVGDPGHVQGFHLIRSFPNPFNPATTISFALPEHQRVVLTVYDLLGRVIAEPLNEDLGPGEHRVQFDASRLASGVYVCRMTAGPHTAQLAVILQR